MIASLNVTSQRLENQSVTILRLAGRLDATTISQLERALTDAQLSGDRVIVIDLSDLAYISSSGLRVLLTGRSNARKRGGEVFLCSLRPPVREVFEMVGFTAVFTIFDTLEQAMEAAAAASGG
ncbi:MAG: anti-sigma factor antagonist [Candidatus Roseilinea sp.]|nr:MAG: anti-sigma factor antagonist [Candidatus Roseilinea sp.]